MAGGVLKGFGGLFLALGILLILAGGGAAGYGAYDQQRNEEGAGPFGIGEDPERSDQNEALLFGGAIAAGIGLVLLIVGIVLLASGGSAAHRAQMRAIAQASQGVPARGAAAATAGSAPAAVPSTQPTSGPAKRTSVAVVAIVAVVLALALAGIVGLGGGAGGVLGLEDDDGDTTDRGLLGEVREPGHMSESVSVLGMGQSRTTSAVPFTTAPDTGRVVLQVNWTAGLGGSERLQVYLEVEEGGVWTLLAEQTGPTGVQVEATDPARLSGASMRARVFPGDDGANSGQDFEVHALFYR